MKQWFSAGSFAAGIVLGVALAMAWIYGNQLVGQSTALVPGKVAATTTPLVSTPGGAVEVSDQPAGNSVLIDSLTVPPPGVWVAVLEVSGSSLGNVLGAARAGGPRAGFSIPLLRATEPGHTYAVQLYRDDGDGAFNVASDSVYVDFDSGERVVMYFKATN